jgi:hypothetical protein
MKITQEQFESLEYFSRMFELHAETIKDLCKTERSDIEYGFALGSTHNDLRRHFMDFNQLIIEIRNNADNLEVMLSGIK